MMCRPKVYFAALLLAAAPAASSSEEAAVVQTVQRFFDAMADRDVEGAAGVVRVEGRFFSVREEEGETVVRSFSNQEFLDKLADRQVSVLERMWEPEVRVHGGIATVWTRYDLYLDGELSHCGVDAFDLVNDGGWKITGGVYTVERARCPESPLGPPSIPTEGSPRSP